MTDTKITSFGAHRVFSVKENIARLREIASTLSPDVYPGLSSEERTAVICSRERNSPLLRQAESLRKTDADNRDMIIVPWAAITIMLFVVSVASLNSGRSSQSIQTEIHTFLIILGFLSAVLAPVTAFFMRREHLLMKNTRALHDFNSLCWENIFLTAADKVEKSGRMLCPELKILQVFLRDTPNGNRSSVPENDVAAMVRLAATLTRISAGSRPEQEEITGLSGDNSELVSRVYEHISGKTAGQPRLVKA